MYIPGLQIHHLHIYNLFILRRFKLVTLIRLKNEQNNQKLSLICNKKRTTKFLLVSKLINC